MVFCALFVATSCAQSDDAAVPPASDAAVDVTMDAPTCGLAGLPCCSTGAPCKVGAFCNGATCRPQNPMDIGKSCVSPADCETGLCSIVGGLSDAGVVVPEGGPPAPHPTACTTACTNQSQCFPGWTCTNLVLGQGVCTCTWTSPETCDGLDDNCDGKVDEEPYADQWCSQQAGVPQKCVTTKDAGTQCVCVDSCMGNCVDLQNDSNNCGVCNKTCKMTVEKCKGGQCVCAFTVCQGDGGATECIDITTDPQNCGGCGHPCGYGCTLGMCGPETIAANQMFPQYIAVDGTNVYWFAGSGNLGLFKCPIAGGPNCTPTSIAPNQYTYGLAAGGPGVFWSDYLNNVIHEVDTGSTTPKIFAMGQSYPQGIATDANNVYWADNSTNQIMKCPLTGTCVPAVLVTTVTYGPMLIAVDATNIYWQDSNDQMWTRALTGGTNTMIVSFGYANQMAAAGGRLYWADSGSLYTCPATGCGGSGTIFSSGQAYGVTTDGVNVYWSISQPKPNGAIKKCGVGATCAVPTTSATGLDTPTYMTMDATSIYWLESPFNGGAVKRWMK